MTIKNAGMCRKKIISECLNPVFLGDSDTWDGMYATSSKSEHYGKLVVLGDNMRKTMLRMLDEGWWPKNGIHARFLLCVYDKSGKTGATRCTNTNGVTICTSKNSELRLLEPEEFKDKAKVCIYE